MSWTDWRLVMVGLAIACVASGCPGSGGGPKRYALHGKVTREGIPIDDGSIMFKSKAGEGADISAGTPIVNGEYKFADGDGVPEGSYTVVINQYPKRDMEMYKGKKSDAPVIEDTRFKKPIKPEGWTEKTTVEEGQKEPIDFSVP